MAEAFHTLYGNVKETLHPEDSNTENPAEIFTNTADKVCAKCVLRTGCWQKDYQDTRTALNDATGPILARGRALATDFTGPFPTRCVHFPEFLGRSTASSPLFCGGGRPSGGPSRPAWPCAASTSGWTSSCAAPPRRSLPA